MIESCFLHISLNHGNTLGVVGVLLLLLPLLFIYLFIYFLPKCDLLYGMSSTYEGRLRQWKHYAPRVFLAHWLLFKFCYSLLYTPQTKIKKKLIKKKYCAQKGYYCAHLHVLKLAHWRCIKCVNLDGYLVGIYPSVHVCLFLRSCERSLLGAMFFKIQQNCILSLMSDRAVLDDEYQLPVSIYDREFPKGDKLSKDCILMWELNLSDSKAMACTANIDLGSLDEIKR